MKRINILLILVAFFCSAQSVMAEEWSYDFENFASAIKGEGPKKAIDATLNGLDWHMYGVRSKVDDAGDYAEGQGSMRIYGTINSAKEMTNFTLTSPRDIGTFKFMIGANSDWKDHQVEWIVQWSTNGESWTTVGEAFKAGETAVEISRTINQRFARVRIVRADYTEFEFGKASSYSYIANIDNMTITDISAGPTVSLTASTSELNFGELVLGTTLEKTFTVSYTGGDGTPQITVKGQDEGAFTFTRNAGENAGTETIAVTCRASRRGTHSAFLSIVYGNLTTNVNLTAVGKKADENQLFSGGEGTEANPYLISSDVDLLELSDEVEKKINNFKGKYFKMTNNISMRDVSSFRSIGNNFGRSPEETNFIRPFSGIFDGSGYTVSDLRISRPDNTFCGLFGIVSGATIKNLTVSKSNFYAQAGVAAIVGVALGSSTIENCHTTADVEVSNERYYAAGICGGVLQDDGARVSDCTNAATVTGSWGMTAGVIAYADQPGFLIERCGNYGAITDRNSHVGGIIAATKNTIYINDCYNAGDINMLNEQGVANTRGAGILGSAETIDVGGMIYINNCYNVGKLSTLAQSLHPIFDATVFWEPGNYSLNNNYYSQEINGITYDSEIDPEYAVISLTIQEMKSDDFLKKLNRWQSTWIFKDGVNNGFPVPQGQINTAIEPTVATTQPAIAIVDGKLTVNGNYTDIAVYDINGKRINANASLTKGMYIVKVTIDGKTFVTKLVR